MKRILLLLFAVFTAYSASAQLDTIRPIVYEGVVTIDNVKKNDLYDRAKLCVVSIYKDAKEVVQLDDKDKGIIICKGKELKVMDGVDNNISYTLSIFMKDGRYKYVINDISHSGGYYSTQIKSYKEISFGALTTATEPEYRAGAFKKNQLQHYNTVKAYAEKIALSLIAEIKQAMDKEPTVGNDNW